MADQPNGGAMLDTLERVADVAWARDLACQLLGETLPRRWSHTQGVGGRAEEIAHVVGDDAPILISAAWLHDIGYAPALVRTGLHPLDGARHLRDVVGAEQKLCRLVAHHSAAVIEAGNRGLADDLVTEFPPVGGLVADALTYCDMTTSPDGAPVDAVARLDEILSRYGDGHVVTESITRARPLILDAVASVERLLRTG
ncbi:HD domain-containing protein [Actinomycetes bacterium KLBMP 9797]